MKKPYEAPEFEYIDLLSPAMMDSNIQDGTNIFSHGDEDTGETNWGDKA